MAGRQWPNGWWIEVYNETEASKLVLQSGPSRDDNGVWGNWQRGGPNRIPMPEEQQNFNVLFVQITNPEKKQCEAAVLYDGQVKKRYAFDGTHEWHNVDRR